MEKITIHETNEYNVFLGENIVNLKIKDIEKKYNNIIILQDNNIKLNFNHTTIFYEASEKNKDINNYNNIIEELLNNAVPRLNTILIVIGGGITLDMGGFIASTYKRGIDLCYIPTSLMAMVDVCIGSKNGLNMHGVKNMIGNFYSPKYVIIDTTLLNTLPKREFNNGMAEIIKYGLIYDYSIIEDLLLEDYNLYNIIIKSINTKKFFIEKDPVDLGIRKYLNFGHTYGHAIEAFYEFERYKHGEAIAIGMNMKCTDDNLIKLCTKFNLPIKLEEEINLEEFYKNDKKNDSNINFIYLNKEEDGYKN